MLTSAVTAADTSPAKSLTASAPDLGQEEFLRMLIAQLENQDPLNPQESTEFTAQLAQFSSLEQEIAMRASLGEISSAMARTDSVTAIGMIGQEVLVESPYFEHAGGATPLEFELSGATDSTVIVIQNEHGRAVRTIDMGDQPGGLATYSWNGLDDGGNPLPAGVYGMRIDALSGTTPVDATQLLRARVTGADVTTAVPVLLMGDLVAPLSGVREVRESGSAAGTP